MNGQVIFYTKGYVRVMRTSSVTGWAIMLGPKRWIGQARRDTTKLNSRIYDSARTALK